MGGSVAVDNREEVPLGMSTAPMPAMRAFKHAALALARALGRTTLFCQ